LAADGKIGGRVVKIVINTDDSCKDIEVAITCNRLTPEIEKMVAMLRMLDMQLTGMKGGETFLIDSSKVLYIDTVDKKTFLYTKDQEYETNLRLHELEEQLMRIGFFRANKSSIINFRHIISLKADVDRKIRVTMSNGENLMISRQYADYVKERLGVK
jgi:DNA-binding LytR/AlgR family response regulator